MTWQDNTRQDYTRKDKTKQDRMRQDKTMLARQWDNSTTSLTSEKWVYIQPIQTVTDVTDVRELNDFKPIEMFLIRHITGKTSVDGAEAPSILSKLKNIDQTSTKLSLSYQAFSGRKWLFLLNFETIYSFAGNFPHIFLRTRSITICLSFYLFLRITYLSSPCFPFPLASAFAFAWPQPSALALTVSLSLLYSTRVLACQNSEPWKIIPTGNIYYNILYV